jgi:invasion protein IalB
MSRIPIGALLVLVALAPAAAQTDEPAQRGAAPTHILSPWTKVCERDRGCVTGSALRHASGRWEIVAALIEDESRSRKILRITPSSPNCVRLYLGLDMRISIDQEPGPSVAMLTCAPLSCGVRCIYDVEATPALIERLARGRILTIEVKNGRGEMIPINLPLTGFADAFAGPPAETK